MDVEWILEAVEEEKSWMTPMKDYLLSEILSRERNERKKLVRKALWFMMQGVLFTRGFYPFA